ncbi:MAG: hypothetical protein Q4B58_07735, partial [Bacteroidales bacterium]|nr:hypothetical protein [Bacteroidales bacterium]
MKQHSKHILLWLPAALLCACADEEALNNNTTEELRNQILVGVETCGLRVSTDVKPVSQSRAEGDANTENSDTVQIRKPAEQLAWLVTPLKQGLDITYGLGEKPSASSKSNERVAKLKLSGAEGTDDWDKENGLAKYTFTYKPDPNKDDIAAATWMGNGYHYFQGLFVPEQLKYENQLSDVTTPDGKLTTNQSNDSEVTNQEGNYTLLTRYLSMPANTKIPATVQRILLPFSHRLARVLAYIVIDPELKTKIKGYKVNGETPALYFCNVDVLGGVKKTQDTANGIDKLTPTWATKVRKVVPHFHREHAELVVYDNGKRKVYPTMSDFEKVEAEVKNHPTTTKYEKKTFTQVPIFDLIVRPTYTSANNVMYDEEAYGNETKCQQLADYKNKIDFLVTLENGLTYEKEFVFDLDANYQTIVYLHITREGVDYNQSGSELWQENKTYDDYYGVDNLNGNTLSKTGSTWQRAFTLGKTVGDTVTDGGYYDENVAEEDSTQGQYLTAETWKKFFLEAYEGGEHHGDYFILNQDITLTDDDLANVPDDFVFTGHLDAYNTTDKKYHTITLDGTRGYLFGGLNGVYKAPQEEEGYTGPWLANVHKETY